MMTLQKTTTIMEKQKEESFVVAMLVPHNSPAMQHYVERIAAFLHVLLPGVLSVQTVDTLPFKRDKEGFGAFLSGQTYDFYLCIGAIPAKLFCAASSAGFTKKPGMILSDEVQWAGIVPSNVMNSCLPNGGELLCKTMMSLLPDIKKVLLCGSRYSLDKAVDLQTIQRLFTQYHIDVEQVCITSDTRWKKAFSGHAPYATAAVTSFEPKMFQRVGEIVAHARKNKVFTFATNVFAIHEGVDFAFGYPEGKVFRRVSEKILACLQQGRLESEVLSLVPSLHCNVENISKHKEFRKRVEQVLSAPKSPIKIHLHANKEARR